MTFSPEIQSPNGAIAVRETVMTEVGTLYQKENPLLGILQSRGRIKTRSGGTSKTQIYYTEATDQTRSIGPFEVLKRKAVSNSVQASWRPGAIHAHTIFSGLEKELIENSGNGKIIDAIDRKNIDKLMVDLKLKFGYEQWYGDASPIGNGTARGFMGLLQAIPRTGTSTGTHAGLSRATLPEWRPFEVDAATDGLTGDLWTDLDFLVRRCISLGTRPNPLGGRNSPDLVVCNKEVHPYLQTAANASQTNMNVSDVGGKMFTLAGHDTVIDENIVENDAKFINTDTIHYETPSATLFTGFKRPMGTDYHPEDVAYDLFCHLYIRCTSPYNNGTLTDVI